MIYLDSIALLNYNLKKLNADKRDQVPTSVLPEIRQISSVATTKIGTEPRLMYKMAYEDLLEALVTAQSLTGMKNLTDKMKQMVIDGIRTMKRELCVEAYDYYSTHDFEPTEQIIPIMREVVKEHLFGG